MTHQLFPCRNRITQSFQILKFYENTLDSQVELKKQTIKIILKNKNNIYISLLTPTSSSLKTPILALKHDSLKTE